MTFAPLILCACSRTKVSPPPLIRVSCGLLPHKTTSLELTTSSKLFAANPGAVVVADDRLDLSGAVVAVLVQEATAAVHQTGNKRSTRWPADVMVPPIVPVP